MPAGSRMDLLLAKPKSISDCGSTPGITYLKGGKSCCHVRETALQTLRQIYTISHSPWAIGVKNIVKNSSCDDHMTVKEGLKVSQQTRVQTKRDPKEAVSELKEKCISAKRKTKTFC
ncbi:hypothetical protein WISP_125534 [Willisornis vidua]|uniref:Uncharacterized protein n=1 Tax=Willisornis vidua TaxID=1566151 RepID=A0ABQ9CR80_9PASS|nr:hypothetical protein WISP_125534 [Willisornis vidua]